MKNISKFKKILKSSIVLFCVFTLVGCKTKQYKEKLLNQYLSEKYEDYEIIKSCADWDEGGTDSLSSFVKIDDNYKLFILDFDYKGQSYVLEEESEILSLLVYDNIIVGETTSLYNNTQLTFIVDSSMKNLNMYVMDFCLRYASLKNNVKGFYLEFYYVDSLDKDIELYKQFMISQLKGVGDCFFEKYRKSLGILNGYESNHLWLPTSIHPSYTDNYKDFIIQEVVKVF